MHDIVKLYLIKEDYNKAISKCKELLKEDENNASLWYDLFLSENGNYIHTNFDDLKDEMALQRAQSIAKRREKNLYISEYNLYKNFRQFPDLSILFRYAQMECFNTFEKLSKEIEYSEKKFENIDLEEFYNSLDYVVGEQENPLIFDLNLLLVNCLYLKTKDEECLEILNDLVDRLKHYNSFFSEYKIAFSFKAMQAKFNLVSEIIAHKRDSENTETVTVYDENGLLNRALVYILDKEYDQADNLIEQVLNMNSSNARAYVYKILIENELENESQLVLLKGDLEDDSNFKKAMRFADEEYKKELKSYVAKAKAYADIEEAKSSYEYGVEKKDVYSIQSALSILNKLDNSNDEVKKTIDKCKEKIFTMSDVLVNNMDKKFISSREEAITVLKEINEYPGVDKKIAQFQSEIEKFKLDNKRKLQLQKKRAAKQKFLDNLSGTVNIITIILTVISIIFLVANKYYLSLNIDIDFIAILVVLISTLINCYFSNEVDNSQDHAHHRKYVPIGATFIIVALLDRGLIHFSSIAAIIFAVLAILIVILSSIKEKKFSIIYFMTFLYSFIFTFIVPMAGFLIYIFYGVVIITAIIFAFSDFDIDNTSMLVVMSILVGVDLVFQYFDGAFTNLFDYNILYYLQTDVWALSLLFFVFKDNDSGADKATLIILPATISFIRRSIGICWISYSVIQNNADIELKYNYSMYLLYLYNLVPIIIYALTFFFAVPDNGFENVFKKILSVLLTVIFGALTLMAAWKLFGAIIGCSYVESCNGGGEAITKNNCSGGCDSCATLFLVPILQFVFGYAYLMAVMAFIYGGFDPDAH